MRGWRKHVLLIVWVVLPVTACTSSPDADHGPRPSPGAATSVGAATGAPAPTAGGPGQVSCADSIDAAPQPPDGYRVVVGDVAVPTRTVLQAAESGEADPAARLFAKWGLVVRSGAVVDLRVAPGWEDRARIGWGHSAVPAVNVRVGACPPVAGRTQWLAFAGGTWVAQPGCVPVVVRSGGGQAQVHLSIGVPCDGVDGRYSDD
ncbi:hypothetical protein [Micromonospora peucetia]|uniref:Uncharacterized protein n=1 Tax=Micromonospora peucetia TaxID=47871 RepID=A0A1C6W083_9ACTN|nr:hypothetical protein [Micromonospora peucetia]WSA31767.1 hypothetical protein OIE14_27195 [Micromonospora peucetia]SCL71968.1 hypothetical protein GA0070608_4810 [Micromonospora peucetia]